ncbi:odorant receptor 47a-like [Polyergus mexicanus]|uniref:odorant receptor 47a-like n=1 Tax=Polyergus mexicanus TaxID=615972 RepID=UPI0038B448A1
MSSHDLWNDDIAYVFSTHRRLMQKLGMWPLQKKTVFTIMQWSLTTILQLTIFSFLFMELTGNHRDANTSIETILYFTCTMILILKNLCINANQRKLARNIDAAISDWLSAKNDEESYKIMKEYAFKSRMFTLVILYSGFICIAIYMVAVIVMNVKQIFLQDANISGNISTVEWVFLIPSGDLNKKITASQYVILIVFQALEVFTLCLMQCVSDSFYVNVTLHLTGQLKILKAKFRAFASKPDTVVNNRKHLSRLIEMHCKLAELNQNIEDTFHLIILFQLVIITLLLALLGLRIIFCLQNNDYIELAKSVLVLNFMFMESLVYCYGGDFIQRESEDIFRAMFMTSWFTLPVALMKDLHFSMMRSSYPFRLTGGKFFYVNRETIIYVLKTAASYISVLRVALRD